MTSVIFFLKKENAGSRKPPFAIVVCLALSLCFPCETLYCLPILFLGFFRPACEIKVPKDIIKAKLIF